MDKFLTASKVKITILLAIVYCSCFIFLTGCNQQEVSGAQENYTPINIQSVERGQIEKNYTFSGYIKPIKEVNVSSKSIGEVTKINFDIGDLVNEGDVLFVMDSDSADNNVKSLENQFDSQINQVKSALENVQKQYENANKNYIDMTELYQNDAISKQQFDSAKLAYEQSKIAYETAKKSYDLIAQDSDVSKNSITAQIDIAKNSLNDMEVKSPINGVVASRNIEEGEIIANVPAFQIVDVSKVVLNINIPERMINKVKLNQNVIVEIETIGNEKFTGKIISISPVADERTLTYPIEIEINNYSGKIKSGMYAEITLISEKSEDIIVIPKNAVLLDEQQKYVYVLDGDRVKKANIETGLDNGAQIEVISGIDENQTIVIKGQNYLSNGQKVKVIE